MDHEEDTANGTGAVPRTPPLTGLLWQTSLQHPMRSGGYHHCVREPIRNEAPDNAVLDGGPLDGREHRVESDTTELLVVMEDGARHIYVACQRVQALPHGRVVPVFEYRGRNHPLRSSGTGAA